MFFVFIYTRNATRLDWLTANTYAICTNNNREWLKVKGGGQSLVKYTRIFYESFWNKFQEIIIENEKRKIVFANTNNILKCTRKRDGAIRMNGKIIQCLRPKLWSSISSFKRILWFANGCAGLRIVR